MAVVKWRESGQTANYNTSRPNGTGDWTLAGGRLPPAFLIQFDDEQFHLRRPYVWGDWMRPGGQAMVGFLPKSERKLHRKLLTGLLHVRRQLGLDGRHERLRHLPVVGQRNAARDGGDGVAVAA